MRLFLLLSGLIIGLNFVGFCVIPVSYTHLDVYKRQAVERGIEIPENLDDLVIPEEKQNTVTLDKPEIQ